MFLRGASVPLGSRAIDLLFALLRRRGEVATKDELMAEVWPGTLVEESNLHVQVSALRKALSADPAGTGYLLTVPGRGYRFVAPVQQEQSGDAAPSGAVSGPFSSLPLPDKPSIAVLPFANMSGDPEQQYFADGMAEEILTALARCSGLFVIARNSSFAYKDKSVDIRQVGRELGVRYVLEGSVRRGGDRLRFTAQLIDALSGAHIWADRFDGELNDVFELQDRITANIVGALEPTMRRAEIERFKHKAADLTAYDHLLRAHQLEHEFTKESIEGALRHLGLALEIDPAYAPAMACAAYCYGWRRTQGWTTDVVAETAEVVRLISGALEVGRFDAEVLWMAAVAAWQFGVDEQNSLELAYRALELNPNSAGALTIAGRVEAALLGNYAKGAELLAQAHRLSPRDPRAWFAMHGMTFACLGEGRFAEGAAWARKALAQNPRFTGALRMLAANLAHRGDLDAARKAIADNLRIEPQLTLSSLRARRGSLHADLWQRLSEGLRLAGLPE